MKKENEKFIINSENNSPFNWPQSFNDITNTGTAINAIGQYSEPELMDIIKTETTIELIYKETSKFYYDFQSPDVKVYKEVYSRYDGTMEIIQGEYIPETTIEESYEFEDKKTL